MKLSVGSDHAGFAFKSEIFEILEKLGHEYIDRGCFDANPVDFPDISRLVSQDILDGRVERGVMVCGSGVGAAIACNKIPGIRASVCHDVYTAHQCVEHDHVSVICLGAVIIGRATAEEVLASFLRARPFTDDFFVRRIDKLNKMDRGFVPVKVSGE